MGLGSFIAGALLFGGGGRSENHYHYNLAPRIDYDEMGRAIGKHIVSAAYDKRNSLIYERLDELRAEERRRCATCAGCKCVIKLVEFTISPPVHDASSFEWIPPTGEFLFGCGCAERMVRHSFDWSPDSPIEHIMMCRALSSLLDGRRHVASEVGNIGLLGHVYRKAYKEWFTEADRGSDDIKRERERLLGMLKEPIQAVATMEEK